MFSRVFVTNRGTSHRLPMFLPVYQPHRLTGLLDGWADGPAIDGCIVNAYFLYKQRDLKRRLMTEQDLHDYLSFQRLVATDSGAFQGFTRRLLPQERRHRQVPGPHRQRCAGTAGPGHPAR